MLQCGAPGILELGGDEIKLFANLRYAGSLLGPQRAGALGIALALLIGLTTAGAAMDDVARASLTPLLNVAKPLVGLVFALAIEGSRVVIVGSVVRGQMANKDGGKAAAAKRLSQEAAERKAKNRKTSGWATLVGNLVDGALPGRESRKV